MPRDLKGFGKRRREINRRMADRTRVRQPLLPVLVQHVEARYDHLTSLLEAATLVSLGASFVHQGRSYSRTDSRDDRRRATIFADPSVRVIDHGTGETIHVTMAEDAAFLEWAAVEILRHSGIRTEELCELTHLSIRQYRRPNGESIALLVIAPSKSERERVIPMSADLFHAVAQIVRRQPRSARTIPLVSRYDPHEKTWSEPMPFLLQRQLGTVRGVMAAGTVLNMLTTTVLAIRLAALPGSLVMRTAAQGPQTASTAVGCERETSTPSRPETSSTPTAPTSTPVTPSRGEHYVGKIQYGSRGSDPYRMPTKVQFKDGELTTSRRMLHYSPLRTVLFRTALIEVIDCHPFPHPRSLRKLPLGELGEEYREDIRQIDRSRLCERGIRSI